MSHPDPATVARSEEPNPGALGDARDAAHARTKPLSRREVLLAVAGSAALAGGCGSNRSIGMQTHGDGKNPVPKVPGEELMNQHGVLNRTLLVYEALRMRFEEAGDIDPGILRGAAGVIDQFVERHHERLEGHYVFPRMKLHPVLGPFVLTLGWQHHAGRRITAKLLHLSEQNRLKDPENCRQASGLMGRFVYMYRAHEAREDTVLFPEFRKMCTPHEYDALGEDFAREERERFGSDGFERFVDEVARLEKQLGIFDLSHYTQDV